MKKQILLFVLMFLPLVANADAVDIDGIYYNLVNKTKTAEVTSNPNKYSGKVVIPTSVIYESVEYSVTSIGDGAFSWCSGLTSITIPNSITCISDKAFLCCFSLTSVSIPNSVTSIGEDAFSSCTGLTSVTIPNSVTTIGELAFYQCFGLTSVSIPNSLTTISNYLFSNCSGLTSVTIPNSVTSIGKFTFYGCSSLTSITIPNSVTSIDKSAFRECSSLPSITIPNSVTTIGEYLFEECTALTSIVIPNSVRIIERYAFAGCSSLTSITIGSGIQTIGEETFAKCPNLADVYCYAENVPSTNTNAFDKSYPEYATLHVHDTSLPAYKDTTPWSSFGTFKTLEGDTPETKKCATPSISYGNKKLTFDSDTEGVEFVSEIKVADNGKFYDDRITLTATYEISVYATKTGYENSDVATATLVWSNASFTETTPATAIAPAAEMEAPVPVLIQNNGGTLTIQGAQDGTPISVYTIAGIQAGTAVSQNNCATISTSMQQGDIAIIKIGERSVKVVMK